eukprot:TRINITY_DN662_c2_g1_i2.p2 TRINITY_DN662_c2_g1~~TRINITY_DN662_c2_g1_i2.p2  ORF type:complete len:334 (+),score=51.41 TRINITY_DN662_c2_g1_i2:294-1295(+)
MICTPLQRRFSKTVRGLSPKQRKPTGSLPNSPLMVEALAVIAVDEAVAVPAGGTGSLVVVVREAGVASVAMAMPILVAKMAGVAAGDFPTITVADSNAEADATLVAAKVVAGAANVMVAVIAEAAAKAMAAKVMVEISNGMAAAMAEVAIKVMAAAAKVMAEANVTAAVMAEAAVKATANVMAVVMAEAAKVMVATAKATVVKVMVEISNGMAAEMVEAAAAAAKVLVVEAANEMAVAAATKAMAASMEAPAAAVAGAPSSRAMTLSVKAETPPKVGRSPGHSLPGHRAPITTTKAMEAGLDAVDKAGLMAEAGTTNAEGINSVRQAKAVAIE